MTQDLVVVSYEKDIELLNLFVKSVDKFVPEGLFENFWLVITDNTPAELFVKVFHSKFKWNILYINEIFSPRTIGKNAGYINQQIAKLKISSKIKSQWYWVFDSKNFLLRTLSENDFYRNNKALVGIDRPHAVWDSGYKKILQYYNENYVMPIVNLTPFPMHTNTVKTMLREFKDFERFFFFMFEEHGVCEFHLYSAYLKKENVLDNLYQKHGRTRVTIWPTELNHPDCQPEAIRSILENPPLHDNVTYCGGLHRNAIELMTQDQKQRWADFLLWLGLFNKRIEVYRWFEKVLKSN